MVSRAPFASLCLPLRRLHPLTPPQRLLQLSGHDRPLTQVIFNREGDLLFSAAKSPKICVWHTDNGERLGTFNGHNGVVWSVDVNGS